MSENSKYFLAQRWMMPGMVLGTWVVLSGIGQCGSPDEDGDGWSIEDGDCNDSNSDVHPGGIYAPVYRLFHPRQEDHFYTMSSDEANAAGENGFLDQGILGYAPADGVSETVPIYRLYNSEQTDHFYTASADEANAAEASGLYAFEGVLGHAFSAETNDRQPVFRLYQSELGDHVYTMSSDEAENLQANDGYVHEGIAWYLYRFDVTCEVAKIDPDRVQ